MTGNIAGGAPTGRSSFREIGTAAINEALPISPAALARTRYSSAILV
jgi:hypothetical protein